MPTNPPPTPQVKAESDSTGSPVSTPGETLLSPGSSPASGGGPSKSDLESKFTQMVDKMQLTLDRIEDESKKLSREKAAAEARAGRESWVDKFLQSAGVIIALIGALLFAYALTGPHLPTGRRPTMELAHGAPNLAKGHVEGAHSPTAVGTQGNSATANPNPPAGGSGTSAPAGRSSNQMIESSPIPPAGISNGNTGRHSTHDVKEEGDDASGRPGRDVALTAILGLALMCFGRAFDLSRQQHAYAVRTPRLGGGMTGGTWLECTVLLSVGLLLCILAVAIARPSLFHSGPPVAAQSQSQNAETK